MTNTFRKLTWDEWVAVLALLTIAVGGLITIPRMHMTPYQEFVGYGLTIGPLVGGILARVVSRHQRKQFRHD